MCQKNIKITNKVENRKDIEIESRTIVLITQLFIHLIDKHFGTSLFIYITPSLSSWYLTVQISECS